MLLRGFLSEVSGLKPIILGSLLLPLLIVLGVDFFFLDIGQFLFVSVVTSLLFSFSGLMLILHLRIAQMGLNSNHQVLSTMAEGYVFHNAEGKIVDFNESALKILGLTSDQLTGKYPRDPLWKCYRQDGSEFLGDSYPAMVALKAQQKQVDVIMGVETAGRSVRWIRVNALPVFKNGSSSKVSGVVVTFADVTENFVLERQLADSILQLNNMLEGSQIGSWEWNPKTLEVRFDRMWASLMGFKFQDLNQSYETWKSRVHLDDLALVEKTFNDSALNRVPSVECTYRILHGEGHWIWILDRGFPSEVDEKGEVLYMRRMVQDVSHLKALELSLRQQSERYRENIDELFQTRVRLSQVLDNSPTAVYESTLHQGGRRLNFVSRFVQEITGYDEVEFTKIEGLQFDSIIHPEDIKQVHDCFECASGGRQSYDIRYRIISKSGDIRWVWDKGIASGANGTNLIGALIDVTDQTKLSFELSSAVQRLQLAASAVQLGLWDWDVRLDSLFWDPSLYRTFGLKKENFVSDRDAFRKTFHPEDWAKYQSELEKCFSQKREQFNIEYRIIDGSQRVRQVASAAICTYSEDGKPLRMVGNNWDVTEERESRMRILEMSAWQRSILDSSPYSIISCSVDGKISTFNLAAEKMLGYLASEVVGKFSLIAFHDPKELQVNFKERNKEWTTDENKNFVLLTERTLFEGRDVQEWNYLCANGDLVPVRLVLSPIYDGKGKLSGFLGVAEDLTEQRKMKRVIEMQQAQMLATAKMSSLGEMAGGVAHEINNPLAVIRGRASQLLRAVKSGSIETAQATKVLETVITTSDRIAKIVKGLKTFSRGAGDDPFEPTNIRSVVLETIELCAEKFKQSGVKLVMGSCPDFNFEARATQISQVLLNLLSNAYDAVEKLEDKWVMIEVASDFEERIAIRVTDSGFGIPPELENRIMEPFFTTKGVGKGTGLGLSISRGIIEEHGGSLSLDRSKGEHTCFKIELPLTKKGRLAA